MNKKCVRNDRNFILNHGKNVSFSKYWLHGSQVSLLQLNSSKKSLLNKDSNLIFRSCFVFEYLSQSPSLTFYKSEWSPHCSQPNLCYYYFFLSSFLKSLQPISMKLQILHLDVVRNLSINFVVMTYATKIFQILSFCLCLIFLKDHERQNFQILSDGCSCSVLCISERLPLFWLSPGGHKT